MFTATCRGAGCGTNVVAGSVLQLGVVKEILAVFDGSKVGRVACRGKLSMNAEGLPISNSRYETV